MAWHRLAAGLALALTSGCQFNTAGIGTGDAGGAGVDGTSFDAAPGPDSGDVDPVPKLDPGDVRLFFAVEGRAIPRVFRWLETDSAWNFGPTTTPLGPEIRWMKNAAHRSGVEIGAAASQDGADARFRVLGPAPGGFPQELGALIPNTSAATSLGDVAFEDDSGDVLAVHLNEVGGLDYWFRIDGEWSSKLPVPDLPTSTPPVWVVLSPRAGADDVALAWSTTEDEIGVALWNGDAWNTSSLAHLGELRDITFRNFDIDWESSSGDALVAFGSKSTGRVLYAHFSRIDGTWGSVRQNTQVSSGEVDHVELTAHAESNRIALVVTDTVGVGQLGTAVWEGEGWSNSGERSGFGGGGGADFGADVTWLADGTALVAYAGAPGEIGWLRWSNSGGWTSELADSIEGVGAIESIRIVPIRSGENVMAVFSDDTGALFDAEFVGAAWTALSAGPLTQPPDPVSALDTVPFSFAAHP